MPHSRYFPKISTLLHPCNRKMTFQNMREGSVPALEKQLSYGESILKRDVMVEAFLYMILPKAMQVFPLKALLSAQLKTWKSLFYHLKSLSNEGFPWVWVHLIKIHQRSIFQLHFEEVQWPSEVARSQRRAPWQAAIRAKIWDQWWYEFWIPGRGKNSRCKHRC